MAEFWKAARTEDVPSGQGKMVKAGGKHIALLNIDGKASRSQFSLRAVTRSIQHVDLDTLRCNSEHDSRRLVPVAAKWKTIVDHPCPIRYVWCNAAEREPGTFKDRYLLRMNPYAVIEGLLIAAHSVRAKAIYLASVLRRSTRVHVETG